MAKQIKPVALLSPSRARNKNASAAQASTTETVQKSTVQHNADTMPSASPTRLLSWCLFLILLALLLTPKPELIVYQQQNIQAKSVYWSGIFGLGAGLSDSQMLVFLDDDRREMRLCYAGELAVQCSKYQIIHRGGMLEVGRYLLDQR